MTDEISLSRGVLFVGDYFSLICTIVIDPANRRVGESEDEQAVREASAFMLSYYDFDVVAVSNEVGVIDE